MVKWFGLLTTCLKSSIGAYLEWLGNGLIVTANKIEYKDARLVMPHADAINPQAR